jgi:O-antigen ligase
MTEIAASAPRLRLLARGLLVGLVALSPVVFWHGLIEPFEAAKSTFTQWTALALLALAAAATSGRSWSSIREYVAGLFGGWIGLAVLSGVMSALLSTALSLSPLTSLLGAPDSHMGLLSALALAVLFAASRAVCAEQAASEQVLGAAVAGLALSCGYALVQVLGADPVRWATTWQYRSWPRPSGTQGHPNYLAGHAVMVLPVVLWTICRGIERRLRGQVLAGAILVVLTAATVAVCFSRGALLAGGLAVALVLVGWRKGLPRRSLPAAVLLVLCLLALCCLDPRFRTALAARLHAPLSSPGRWPIWQGAVHLFLDHPWAGSGLDTFGLVWPAVRTPEYWEVEGGFLPGKAHNDFLQALATQGIVGAVAWAMLPCALLAGLGRLWRREESRAWAAVLAGSAVAYYVQNLVGFAVASTAALLAVIAGMVAGQLDGREVAEPTDPPGWGTSFLRPATWLGAFLVVVTLWQGGGGQHPWRLALVGLALFWAARVGLAASPGPPGTSLRLLRNGRQLALPSLGACVLGGLLLLPLVASAVSFQAEAWGQRDERRGLAGHERAVCLAPWSALLHERRARALWQAAGRQASAADSIPLLLAGRGSIEAACRLEPLSASLQATRARILFALARQGRVSRAEVLAGFDRALKLDRCDWFVLADAARASAILGAEEECERYLAAGLAARPRLGLLLAERGALELARGHLATAERTLREALARDWTGQQERYDRAALLLGTVLLESGQAGEALRGVAGVIDRHPDWKPAQLLAARCRERLEKKK